MKIPNNAQKVFKGKIFDVYNWEQSMFDGKTKIFEGLKRNDTIDVIAVNQKGYIYILKEKQPGRPTFYGLVGGTCENLEKPLITAKRELLEETGLISKKWKLFKKYSLSSKIDYNSNIFIAKNCVKIQNQNLDIGGEKIEIKEVDWDEFKNIVLNPKFRVKEFALELLRYICLGKEEKIKNIILK